MKRRTFCAASAAALATAAFPLRLRAAAASDVAAVALDGRQLTLKSTDIDDLRATVRGELITAGEGGYDAARRLWNPAFDRHPALIVRCLGAADVRRAVSFSASHGLLTAVHAGGHSFAGHSGCDGGLVIDVSPMRAVEIDPLKREARVEAGALLGHLDREAQAFALATTAGVAADTGVAGLTLGGGLGRLGRRFGLACDNLLAAELITADGRWLPVSATDNPELLWGLRGGGGNFGVVTAFTFQLHEVGPQVYGGTVTYSFKDARRLLRSFADFLARAPDELYVDVDLDVDEHGEKVVELDVCYSGPLKDAERVTAPLRRLGKPQQEQLAMQPYVKIQGSAQTPGTAEEGIYLKGGFIDGLTPTFIDTLVGVAESMPSDSFEIGFQQAGGAIARVAPTGSAYWNRSASHDMHVLASWKVPGDGAERNRDWVRRAWAQLAPLTRGYYVNISSAEQHAETVHGAYGDNYPRLVALKKRYDPTNLFRLNANINPAA